MLDVRKTTFDAIEDYRENGVENKSLFYKQFLAENILDVLESKQVINLETGGVKVNLKNEDDRAALLTYLKGNAGISIPGESVFISDKNYADSCYFTIIDDAGNEVIKVNGEDEITFMITPNKELSPFDNEGDFNTFSKVVTWLNEEVKNIYMFV